MLESFDFNKKAKRIVKGAMLGAGLLAGQGATDNIKAQTIPAESVAQEDSLDILMERGRKTPGVVFEEGNKLYVVVEGRSRDMQIALNSAESIGRALFAKYLTGQMSVYSIHIEGARFRKQERGKEGNLFKTTILMEMPKPRRD